MGLLIVLIVLAGILLLPLSIIVCWDNFSFKVSAGVGPISFQIYPGKEKPEKQQKETEKQKEKTRLSAAKIRYLAETVPDLIRRLLGRVRRNLQVDPVQIYAVFRGEDPADVAIQYGRFQALAAALLPVLEETVSVGRVEISLSPDFTDEGKTESRGTVGFRIRVAPLLGMGAASLADLIRWYRGWKALTPKQPAAPVKNKQANEA